MRGALVSCAFPIGDEAVEVHAVVTGRLRAEPALTPVITSAGRLPPDGVASCPERTAAGRAGGHRFGCLRHRTAGSREAGDAALLLVTAGAAGRTTFTARQVTAPARALHAQTA
ncbi:hypothetical protein [Streptomyces sp. NPDC048295]|uniref:hypothetical protein n=1 Tax=Streptomyces sp. NPDC048295 TaxID=3154617 RepID=UPI0034161565